MSSQPPIKQPARPALVPTSPTSSVSRRAALRGLGGLSAALLIGATSRVAGANSAQTAALSKTVEAPASVVGAWNVSFRPSEAAGAPGLDRAIATFGAEGGFQAALAPVWRTSAGTSRFHGGGHGTWSASDDGVVVGRYTTLIYDETGSNVGARKITIRVSLESSGFFTGSYLDCLYDVEGTLVEPVSGTVEGIIGGI